MIKVGLLIIVYFFALLLFCGDSTFAGDYETIKAVWKEEPDKINYVNIRYNSTGTVGPNTIIAESQVTLKYRNPTGYTPTYEVEVLKASYTFLGRTGDKTFEVRFIDTGYDVKNEKISMFFEENELVPLDLKVELASSCTKTDKIYMKMFKLKGNQLEYQIILPDCLKNKLEKAE